MWLVVAPTRLSPHAPEHRRCWGLRPQPAADLIPHKCSQPKSWYRSNNILNHCHLVAILEIQQRNRRGLHIFTLRAAICVSTTKPLILTQARALLLLYSHTVAWNYPLSDHYEYARKNRRRWWLQLCIQLDKIFLMQTTKRKGQRGANQGATPQILSCNIYDT